MKKVHLSDTALRKMKTRSEVLTDSSIPGLSIKPSTRKGAVGEGAWQFRYISPITKKNQYLVFGHYPTMNLATARMEASNYRNLVKSGRDPKFEKQQAIEKQEKEKRTILRNVIEECMSDRARNWKGGEHGESYKKWSKIINKHILPNLGDIPIGQITPKLIAENLKKVWSETHVIGDNIFQIMNAVWDFAFAREYVESSEIVKKARLLMPTRMKKEGGYPSQPYQQIPAFVQDILQKRGGLAGCKNSELLLLFTIINAARGSAARLLNWEDVDLEEKVWTLRANKEKSKVKTDSYYPITPIQMQILEEMKKRRIDETQAVFPSNKPSKNGEFYLSDNTLNKILKDHKVESDVEGRFAVVHGYRSSFSNYAAENRKYQINDDGEIVVFDRDLSEKQLQHKIKNKVRGAYERTSEIEARRVLVTEWEQFIFCTATSW